MEIGMLNFWDVIICFATVCETHFKPHCVKNLNDSNPLCTCFFEGFNGSATYARVLFRQGDTTLAGHFAYWHYCTQFKNYKDQQMFLNHILFGLYYMTRVVKVLGLESLSFDARVLFHQGDTTLAGHFAYWRTIALSLQTIKTRKYF